MSSLGVGVIGLGIMGADHVDTLRHRVAGADVVAVSDRDIKRAESVARDAACCAHVYVDPIALISDDKVDAVLVASPDATHERLLMACLSEGKQVLCEKPLAPNPAACLRIVQAETRFGRRLIDVGFMRRFDPGYRALKRILQTDQLGRPLVVHCIHRNLMAPSSYDSDMLITSSASHEIDVARWLLAEEIRSVEVRFPRRSGLVEQQLQDPQLLMLESDSGVIVTVEVFVNSQYGYDVRCEVVGERGTASLPAPSLPGVRHDGHVGHQVPSDWRERFADAYREELQSWVHGLRTGSPTGASAWDGYVANAVGAACLVASRRGGVAAVDLPPRPRLYGG